jgi:hypothetical protein
MKKTNKFIPVFFFTMILVIIALHIVLFVIYQNGNVGPFHAENTSPSSAQSLPQFLFFSIYTLTGGT